MSVGTKFVIYQLVIRYFGNTNETNQPSGTLKTNGCGKFADIDETALRSLKDLGVTHIWLTGCQRQATLTAYPDLELPADDPDIVKGIAGSFYAVRDYFDVCPDYAKDPSRRSEEFRELIDRIHAEGMRVLIDFVPNHVSRNHASVIRPDLDFGKRDDQTVFYARDNSFFYLVEPPGQQLHLAHPPEWNPSGFSFDGLFEREDGGPGRTPKATGNAWKHGTTASPSDTDWYEAIKLNYGFNYVTEEGDYQPVPRTWRIMNEVLAFWQQQGVDGFRCDMAQLVPAAAWSYLISHSRATDRNPETYFLAEAYVGTSPFDPVKTNAELIDAGFDGIYHDNSFNRLSDLYRGGSQERYHAEMGALSGPDWSAAVEYLENHDKPRVAAPVSKSGFGSIEANHQLAPLQFLYSSGPVLILNGQEIGEDGAGAEGYAGDDGRTTFFDYWCMPEFAKWVNGHAYDGARLSEARRALRAYFADLFALCQHPTVRGNGYWGLKSFNQPWRFSDCPDSFYSFARFEPASGQLLLVVANFAVGAQSTGQVRIPEELAAAAGLADSVSAQLIFDRHGKRAERVLAIGKRELIDNGLSVSVPDQAASVFLIS